MYGASALVGEGGRVGETCGARERGRAAQKNGKKGRKEGRKKERKEGRKRSLYARVCLVVTRGASIQPVARLAHSFLHSYTLHAI